jgi:hypothetical protein
MRSLTRGLGAGAVGTALINMSTYADMALRGRPPSPIPEQDVRRVAALANISLGADDQTAAARRSAFASLMGYATGFGVGVAYGALTPLLIALPRTVRAALVGMSAMALTDVASTALGTTDPRSWSMQAWAADAIPHLIYGAGVVTAYEALDHC